MQNLFVTPYLGSAKVVLSLKVSNNETYAWLTHLCLQIRTRIGYVYACLHTCRSMLDKRPFRHMTMMTTWPKANMKYRFTFALEIGTLDSFFLHDKHCQSHWLATNRSNAALAQGRTLWNAGSGATKYLGSGTAV